MEFASVERSSFFRQVAVLWIAVSCVGRSLGRRRGFIASDGLVIGHVARRRVVIPFYQTQIGRVERRRHGLHVHRFVRIVFVVQLLTVAIGGSVGRGHR